jgi:hypothetical protein
MLCFLVTGKVYEMRLSNIPMIRTRVAPFGSISYKTSGKFHFKEDRRVYINVPLPVGSMHF